MQQLFGSSFTKKPPFRHSENEKWIFRAKKMKTSLGNIVCHSNMHPLCTIWDHLKKLCHERGHKIDHLAWKPLIFRDDSSFLITLFLKNFCITSLLFFLGTWPHIMTQCEGFLIFWIFLNFLCPFQNAVKTVGMTVPS